jgi:aminodeoxyfutalosine synthase
MSTRTVSTNLLERITNLEDETLASISNKVSKGERITNSECLYLYENGDIGFLGALANVVREKHNGNRAYFNRNFHIEPTNVCVFSCKFCSYSRSYKNRTTGWELTRDEILQKIDEYKDTSVTEVHIVGGVHPKMDLTYFGEILKTIKEKRPDLHIKAFTAVELDYMFRKAKLSYHEGFKFLKECGLDSIPGGGAEIFDETIRKDICDDKCSSEEWLMLHQTAHETGIPSNATMLYGHIESFSHRVDHMDRLRQLQDKTNGFNTFIPLKFRNHDNEMSHINEVTMNEDLRNYAISRIYMDNFPHIKAYWPMIGRDMAQLSLSFGVDDIDGTIDDSTKIYSMAGAEEQNPAMSTTELVQLIKDAGKTPVERGTLYEVIEEYA